MNVALLLPHVRLDSAGINLEDFFRQVLLAAKAAHPENLYFPLYPLTTSGPDLTMAVPNNTLIALRTENRLGRFIVLPEEGALIRLYRQMAREAMLSSVPHRWRQEDFHHRYLEGLGFPTLTLAFDALFWLLVQRTSRTLSVPDGLQLVHSFFLDEDILCAGEQVRLTREKHASIIDPAMRAFEFKLELASVPFDADTTYVVVNREDAPVEGANTYSVRFELAALAAHLTAFLSEREYTLVEELPSYRRELEDELLNSFVQRFGSCLREPKARRQERTESVA